jgi:hypothetical protein
MGRNDSDDDTFYRTDFSRIMFTGGPCAGKTTAMAVVA